MSATRYLYIILALTLLASIFIRVRLLDLPLERDEGEFALMGQMILNGTPPYREAYNLKPPGIYLAYAAVMALFGETPSGIHAGLLLVNLTCAFLLFRTTWKIAGPSVAASSTAAFLALSLMPKVLGLNAHATHFVLLAALGGILLLADLAGAGPVPHPGRPSRPAIFLSGILMGISVLMKQPGVFFALFGALVIFRGAGRGGRTGGSANEGRGKTLTLDLASYSLGVAIPIAAALAWLSLAGVFDRFWFWVVTYAVSYGSEVGVGEGMEIAAVVGWSILAPSLVIGIVACAGFPALRGAPHAKQYFIVALLLSAALGVAMGLHFRRHYFVLLLPAVSILFGLGLEWLGGALAKKEHTRRAAPVVAALLALIAVGQTFAAGSGVYFASTPAVASRMMFGPNPFVESAWIADRVREMTSAGERVAVVGSEPQIYFYADRLPATGYIYMYGLVDRTPIAGTMRREMIAEIESRKPAAIVYVNSPASWLLDGSSDRSVFTWLEGYLEREGYGLVGMVEIVSPQKTVALLGEEARAYRPAGGEFVQLWKRRE